MDSMRSLNRSLPSSAPIQARTAPPEQILQAFKQAALSVTNLYKAAATDQEKARQGGYQDAIEDLLHFLDRENIGLQDGEGWRIREWATAQHSHGGILPQSDDDDETSEQDPAHSRDCPVEEKSSEETRHPTLNNSTIPSPSSIHPAVSTQPSPLHQQSTHAFQFSASHDSNIQSDEGGSRSHRHVHRNSRHNRPSRSIAQNAGSKRKLPFPDLTEIFNVNFDRKDGSDGGSSGGGGSKRSRVS